MSGELLTSNWFFVDGEPIKYYIDSYDLTIHFDLSDTRIPIEIYQREMQNLIESQMPTHYFIHIFNNVMEIESTSMPKRRFIPHSYKTKGNKFELINDHTIEYIL